ncbi:hypothetical protein K9U40_10960 [Xanthobacter autotrophicus]|uniref:hypothetical protein n=1 Tax=Xanthobacter TaxID=279 RepID=UPI0024ABAD10|nr:hypothetical protein [Xanthobacter autotrophicus]MDI4664844.1 hypothetical protein [Xanthobacter autotrophicus]
MNRTVLALSLTAFVSVAAVTEAAAWTRSGSTTTPRGTYTSAASGGCSGGTCSRSATASGPYGGTVSRSGSVSQTAPGAYNYSRTTTGPNGNSVSRSGSVSRY